MDVICLKSLTREELIETLRRCPQETDKSLEGVDLSGLDLSDLDLSGFNLNHTLFLGCICRKTKFIGADLYRARLEDGIFDEADFSHAKLIYTNLTDASLQKTVCCYTDFYNATLTDVQAQEANFSSASFDRTILISTNLERTTLDHAEFIVANLSGANLLQASTKQTKFINCDLHFFSSEPDLHNHALIDDESMTDAETAKSIPPLQNNLLRKSSVSLIPSQRVPNIDSSKAS